MRAHYGSLLLFVIAIASNFHMRFMSKTTGWTRWKSGETWWDQGSQLPWQVFASGYRQLLACQGGVFTTDLHSQALTSSHHSTCGYLWMLADLKRFHLRLFFGKILWNYDLLWVRTKQLDSGTCWSQFKAPIDTTWIYVKILALSHGIFVGGACSPVSMVAEELERSVWEPSWVLSSDKSNHESISIKTPHVSGTYV